MRTNIMVKWSKHQDKCDYSFRLTDPISLLSRASLIQMERQEAYDWTGIGRKPKESVKDVD